MKLRIALPTVRRGWWVVLLFDGGWLSISVGLAHMLGREVWYFSLGLLAWAHAALLFYALILRPES